MKKVSELLGSSSNQKNHKSLSHSSQQSSHRAGFTPLQRLLKQAEAQKRLTATVQTLLEPPLKHQITVTGIEGPVLLVQCTDSSSATRMRFEVPNLLPQLQQLQDFSAVRSCRISVAGR